MPTAFPNLEGLSNRELEELTAGFGVPDEVSNAANLLRLSRLAQDANALIAAMAEDSDDARMYVQNIAAIKDYLDKNPADDLVEAASKVEAVLEQAVNTGAQAIRNLVPAPQAPERDAPLPDDASATPGPTAGGDSGAPAGPSVDDMIEAILGREGGFVNDPADRGGPTNFGVTQSALAKWRGQAVTIDDVRNLQKDEAREIYRKNYFLRPKLNRLPGLIQPLLFDMSINHGSGGAVQLLQKTLNAQNFPCGVDGGIGDVTVGCAEQAAAAQGTDLINHIVDKRIEFYHQIVANDPKQQRFLNGWLNRAAEFRV